VLPSPRRKKIKGWGNDRQGTAVRERLHWSCRSRIEVTTRRKKGCAAEMRVWVQSRQHVGREGVRTGAKTGAGEKPTRTRNGKAYSGHRWIKPRHRSGCRCSQGRDGSRDSITATSCNQRGLVQRNSRFWARIQERSGSEAAAGHWARARTARLLERATRRLGHRTREREGESTIAQH
jgi:hypothetical protein